MAVEVGDVVYLQAHAYLRLIGRVSAVLGQRRVALSQASKVYSDDGNDEEFFTRGVDPASTRTAYVGEVPDVAYLAAFAFPFELPAGPKKQHASAAGGSGSRRGSRP